MSDSTDATNESTGFPDYLESGWTPNDSWRASTVRLTLPGQNDQDKRLDTSTAYPLTETCIDLLANYPNHKQIEILSFSAENAQETFITPRLYAKDPAVGSKQIVRGGHDLTKTADETRKTKAAHAVADVAADDLPEEVGIEICSLDFSRLGITPLPTHRFVVAKDRDVVSTNWRQRHPYVRTVGKLALEKKPHVIQTIVAEGSGSTEYLVSLRIAVMDATHAIASDEDFLEHLRSGRHFDLSEIWNEVGLKSNFELPIDEFFNHTYYDFRAQERKYMPKSASEQARKIYEGKEEFAELLQGRMGYHDLYSEVLGYPKMPINEAELRQFMALVPEYYDTNLWDDQTFRKPPETAIHEVIRPAPGTQQPVGSGTAKMPRSTRDQSVTSGSRDHAKMETFVMRYYKEQGKEIELNDQDGSSISDGWLTESEERKRLEIESTNTTKPANVLENAARADSQNDSVVFVSKKKAADTIRSVLEQPYQKETSDGVRLYNWSKTVTQTDGSKLVLPKGASEAAWILNPDGQLHLKANGRTVANGPATEPIQTFDHNLPHYEKKEGNHYIVAPDGSRIKKYPSKHLITENWTMVRVPHVPLDIHYLDKSTIRYKSDERIETLDPTPRWNDDTVTTTQGRYDRAVRKFLSLYTLERPDGELNFDDFYERFCGWYEWWVDDKAPDRGPFGRARPDHIETKRRQVDGTNQRFLKDRAWRYPSGITSPHYPFIDSN